ncbi:DNA-directed RNA polymerase subunit omega [bacterium]|nr:DNA-directed RNA polymerase subunit omega [bacterium]|tara:strand:- start:208 stop:594 length:387 start_codon:yes stop_codon:yes gene_type:complete
MSNTNNNNRNREDDLNFPKIDPTQLLKKIPNRFLLSVAIAKRARQISEGERPLVEVLRDKPMNPINIAMKEFNEGLITITEKNEVDDELELIEKLDKNLEERIEKQKIEDEKNKPKEKTKKKSKSLLS